MPDLKTFIIYKDKKGSLINISALSPKREVVNFFISQNKLRRTKLTSVFK